MKPFDEVAAILKQDLPTLKCGPVYAEYQFDEKRKWRFDWAIPMVSCAIEIDGGAWTQGRHTRGKGFIGDLEKLNAATAQGWKVFRFTPQAVKNGDAMEFLKKALR